MGTETRQRAAKKRTKAAPCRVTLPDHLVAEVLVRLPATSLARLRCACRSWDAEISSRAFQERHHALAAAKLALLQSAPAHITYLQVRCGNRRPSYMMTNCKDCPRVLGSKPCFGLVLVQKQCDAASYSVCNPTTGDILHLPPSHSHSHQTAYWAAGIGFHASAREFKVVKVNIQSGKLHARLLTVGDVQGWRAPAAAHSLQVDFSDDDIVDPYLQPVFADGRIHWILRRQYLDKPHGILCFSLADETFRRVAQPSFSTADVVPYDFQREQQHEYQIWRDTGVSSESGEEVAVPIGKTLAELDGRLCMMRDVRHRSDLGGFLFEVWKLQDYDMGSWSLDYRIDLTPGRMAERLTAPWLVVPLRYLDGGDEASQSQGRGNKRRLLLATTAREAHVYDPDSGTLRTVVSIAGGDDSASADDSPRLVLYQESLVRFPGMKQGKGEIEFVKLGSAWADRQKQLGPVSYEAQKTNRAGRHPPARSSNPPPSFFSPSVETLAPAVAMLSGVKLVPREQIVSGRKDGGGSDSDSTGGKRRAKRSKRERDKKKDRRRSRRRRRYSSEEESGSDTDDSIGEEEEEEVGRSKRRGKHRKRRHEFSDDDSESSESDRGRARGKGKQRGGDDEDEDEEDAGGEGLRASEVVRREMGLEWMLKPASSSRAEGSSVRKADNDEKIEAANEEIAKPNPKELNPYLKDSGTGYPEESTPPNAGNQLLASSVVGDGGASWRLKALKRAKEQAAREGRKLEEVAEERWGSLGNLAASVSSSSSRAAHSHAHLHAIRGRKFGNADNSEERAKGNPEGRQGGDSGRREYLCDVSSQHHSMRKPKPDSVPWKRRRNNISSEDQELISSTVASLNKFSDDGSFMEKISDLNKNKNDSTASASADEQRHREQKHFKESSEKAPLMGTQKLNANQLAAKILQLRMKGKNEEAEQLSREMEALLENQVPEEPSHHGKGRSSIRDTLKPSAADRRRREENGDLHLANKIMHNKQYSMSKSIEDEYDFGDAPSKKGKRKNKEAHEERSTNRQMLTQKERCLYCFENPSRPKHLVVAIGNFTYLMLPQFEPVVPGHCIILPLQHESATRTVDQNAWGEIRNFKKCLLKMFAQQDKDVVFMETVISLARQRRHCMIECIPVPCDVSSNAPMYFKKAIDEAEEEWTQHEMKKVIPTSASRNLRQAIPENFAYFHVEFGLDRGFVHVIDDESKFSAGFGLNVIRGMLQLPEEDMHRRQRHESVDNQKRAVASFKKDWEPFDWTKQLD